MSEHARLAFHLAWAVGIWHLTVAGYLVFFSRANGALLTALALTKGLLGACLYIVIREPTWVVYGGVERYLVPFTILLLFAFSALVTILIWNAYDLRAPRDRLREILAGLPYR